MWIFTSTGFLSVVAHRAKPDHLLVRARRAGEIESVFPNAATFTMDLADYLHRAILPRGEVADAIAASICNMQYDNFKNSISDNEYHNACFGVWNVMHRYQADASEV